MPKMVTSRGDYGLLFMVYLVGSSSGDPKPVSEVSSFFGLPQPFLEQIALDLKQAGFIRSVRGKSGGYFLSRSPESISVREVLEALEGPITAVSCQLEGCSASSQCLTHDFWEVFQKHLQQTLGEITLDDLAKSSPAKIPSIKSSQSAKVKLEDF